MPFCTMEYITDQAKYFPLPSKFPLFQVLKLDFVEGLTQNVFLPKSNFCEKRASKIIVMPKEMLLLFSIETFLTNYYVTNRKL